MEDAEERNPVRVPATQGAISPGRLEDEPEDSPGSGQPCPQGQDEGTKEVSQENGATPPGDADEKLSKRKLRKMKKKENALKYRAEKRLRERENKKRRKRELREAGVDLGPSKKQLKRNTMANSACRVRVAIDCDFDNLMSEKDIMKLTQQLSHSYSANRRAADPLQFYVTSLGGQTKARLDRIGDYASWDVNFREENYLHVFDKSSLVYLSAESDNVLTSLQDDKVYIIGGLVDHNHYKGLCHELAQLKGVSHAQLPIGQYIDLKSRKVLTINHVFEILLRYTESRDWEKAFFQVLPKRKGVTCKTDHSNRIETQGENEGNRSDASLDKTEEITCVPPGESEDSQECEPQSDSSREKSEQVASASSGQSEHSKAGDGEQEFLLDHTSQEKPKGSTEKCEKDILSSRTKNKKNQPGDES